MAENESMSQDEINDLLASIGDDETEGQAVDDAAAQSAGEESYQGRSVRILDLRRPEAFTQEAVERMNALVARWMEQIGWAWKIRSGVNWTLHTTSIDVLTYEEYLRIVPDPGVFVRARADRRKSVLIEPAAPLSVRLARTAMGYNPAGSGIHLDQIHRELIGSFVRSTVVPALAGDMAEPVEGFEVAVLARPNLVDLTDTCDMVLVISASVQCDGCDEPAMLSICLPSALTELLANQSSDTNQSERPNKQSQTHTDQFAASSSADAEDTAIRITVSLGWAVLPVSHSPLRPGDIVALNHTIDDPVCVRLSTLKSGWALGELVLIDDALGVRITSLQPCSAAQPEHPNGRVVTVSAGEFSTDSATLEAIGEGTVIPLQHPMTVPFRLRCGSVTLAEGRIRSVLPMDATVEQEWQEGSPPDPRRPVVAFVVTRTFNANGDDALRPPQPAQSLSVHENPSSAIPLHAILSVLPAASLEKLFQMEGPLFGGWLLQRLAQSDSSTAATHLQTILENQHVATAVAFATCDTTRSLPATERRVARHLQAVLTPEEKEQAVIIADAFDEPSEQDGTTAVTETVSHIPERLAAVLLTETEKEDPERAQSIRDSVFFFQDLQQLDDRSIQKVLREIEMADLVTALIGAADETKNAITRNMSRRAAQMLEQEMQYNPTASRPRIDDARLRISTILHQLVRQGDILI